MTNTKHTPTPWHTAPSGHRMAINCYQSHAITQAGTNNLIGGCFSDVLGGADTVAANAALIVRAVNSHEPLIEALEDLMDCITAWQPVFLKDENWPRADAEIRAALKLAKEG